MLTDEQRKRYARQWPLPGWSEEAHLKLARSRILVVGAGGLGSAAAYYLAAAGAGTIILADPDSVELSNLNRQILHCTKDIDRPKVESAKEKLEALNPECSVIIYREQLDSKNAHKFFEKADVVLDCTDGFPSKYLLNDVAVATGKPLVHAGVLAWSGQVFFVWPGKGPCLRCVFPEPPKEGTAPSSLTMGILGAVAGVMGAIEATEAIKYITGTGSLLVGRMLTYDAMSMQWQQVRIARDASCSVCGGSKKRR